MDSLRLINNETSKLDEVENIFSKIVGKVVKDVISSDNARNLIKEISDQHPRLYCFFDKTKAVTVNDLYSMSDE